MSLLRPDVIKQNKPNQTKQMFLLKISPIVSFPALPLYLRLIPVGVTGLKIWFQSCWTDPVGLILLHFSDWAGSV